MRAVFWRECRHQFFSFRSVFFVFLFVVLGFSLNQLFALTSVEIGGIDNKTYAGSFYVIIKLAVMLLGYLFASILSHSSINRETERKSVRLVISKISRTEYVTGKFSANVMFWVICFVLIYGCLFLKYKVFDVGELITNWIRRNQEDDSVSPFVSKGLRLIKVNRKTRFFHIKISQFLLDLLF